MGASYSTEGWTYLGPNGGSTSALAIDPGNANVVYALSEMGALFKSTTGGSHWEFLHQLPMQNAKLEVSATQPETLYAYSNVSKDLVNPATGIYRSTDGGLNWAELEVISTTDVAPANLQNINRIRTVPGRPGVLFAASENWGLLRSTDGGGTWERIRDASHQGLSDCTELEVAPTKNKLYAVCRIQPFVVDVDGVTATPLFQPDLADSSYKLKIAIAKSDQGVIYLAATKTSRGHSRLITEIYRSTDSGVTWETRFQRASFGDEMPTPESVNSFNIALPGIFERDCENPSPYNDFEDYQLAVDPSAANTLWIAGAQTYRSDDGGRTFGRAGLDIDTGKAGLVFSPTYDGVNDQRLLIAGQTGIRRTANANAAIQTYPTVDCSNKYFAEAPAVVWSAAHDGYSAAMLMHGATHQYHSFAASLVTASLFEQGTYLGNDASVDSWRRFFWMPSQVVISPNATLDEMYTGDWHISRWVPHPNSWGHFDEPVTPNPSAGFVYPARKLDIVGTQFMHRLVQHPTDVAKLLIPTMDGMYVSTDRAVSFARRGPPEPTVAATFTRDGGVLGVSWDGGFVSENPVGSSNWEKRNLAGCLMTEGHQCDYREADIQELFLSPVPGSKAIYAVGNSYGYPKLYYSTDGRVWTALDRPGQAGGLPDYVGMTTLAVDPNNPSHLYVGTPFGLYASVDHGQTWAAMATPFPLTAVSKLVFDRDADGNRRLFAFTYGRGAWAYQVPQSTTFADVPTYHWAYDYEQRLFNAGITNGCATNPLRYCPEQRVLRDQMAVFLLRAKNGSGYQPPAATGTFSDVPSNHWAAAWIEQLRVEGVTQGCATNPARYCPGDEVLREQMAVFLLRAKYGAAYQPPAAQGVFADVPVNYWAAPWIEQLAREGVTGGCSATPKLYCPATPITRDQMAVFLVRAFGL